jgi:hypothetical protein
MEEIQSNRFAGFGIASIGGYHAAKPRLYQDLVDSVVVPSPQAPMTFSTPWMRLLAIRYIVSPEPLEVTWLRKAYQGSSIVYENLMALPRATLVGYYRVAPDPAAALDSVGHGGYDPVHMTWLTSDPHLSLGGPSIEGSHATITEARLNRVTVEVDAPAPALLRLADLWYPDWIATVDGRRTPILRVDYLLRAVPVSAGRHRVEFRFESKAVRNGLLLSCAGLAVALLLLVGGWWQRRRPREVEAV